ncbi:MAG: hypothetical protein HOB63_10670, partial [Opitutae bacterium]|nr:hypothetical protein [Opitutae bacterium]
CDGSGRLFIGSWSNSGFSGGNGGYVARVVPKGWKYKEFPNLQKRNPIDLANLLSTPSAKTRLHAQQEILRRGGSGKEVLAVAVDKKLDPKSRVAAIYTLKQLLGTKSHKELLKLVDDPVVTEHALRALGDRKTQLDGIPQAPFTKALKSKDPRVQVAAAVALGRLGDKSAASALLSVSNPPEIDPLPSLAGVPKQDAGPQDVHQSSLIDGSKVHTFDVDVSGWKELYLTIGHGGNGDGNDHGGWFEPTLLKKDGTTVKLTDVKWSKATQGWGKTGVGISPTGAKLGRADKKPMAFGIGSHAVSVISYKKLPADVVRFKCVAGLANTHRGGRVRFYVSNKVIKKFAGGGKKQIAEGPHATPNSATILPHVARQALVALEASSACVDAIGTPNQSGALMALRYMHTPEAADALIGRFKVTKDSDTKQRIARSLVRLVNLEKPYKGDTWWSTRPDTRGPYYYPTAWEKTEAISAALLEAAQKGDAALRHVISELAQKDRAVIAGLPKADDPVLAAVEEPTVDLEMIKNKKGQVGKMSVEDIAIAITKIKGNPKKGPSLFASQGCIACHALKKSEVQKGPYLGQIGGIMNAEKIALSIIRPNAEISQGFKTVSITTKKGGAHVGFVTKRLSDQIEIRDIAGQITRLNPADVASETLLPISMMPAGLANGMSIEDFASLVHFLAAQKQ